MVRFLRDSGRIGHESQMRRVQVVASSPAANNKARRGARANDMTSPIVVWEVEKVA